MTGYWLAVIMLSLRCNSTQITAAYWLRSCCTCT